jgi:DNA-binding MarR family transcriptional regulator
MVKHLTNPFRDAPMPLGSLLTAAGQRLSARLDAELQAAGFTDLRAAHAPIFMAIAPEGSRVTDLAERATMTKQAAGELIGYLTKQGYLSVSTDPTDRRAKSVALTDRGWAAIEAGRQVIADYDQWLAEAVGPEQVSQLRDVLSRIISSPNRP